MLSIIKNIISKIKNIIWITGDTILLFFNFFHALLVYSCSIVVYARNSYFNSSIYCVFLFLLCSLNFPTVVQTVVEVSITSDQRKVVNYLIENPTVLKSICKEFNWYRQYIPMFPANNATYSFSGEMKVLTSLLKQALEGPVNSMNIPYDFHHLVAFNIIKSNFETGRFSVVESAVNSRIFEAEKEALAIVDKILASKSSSDHNPIRSTKIRSGSSSSDTINTKSSSDAINAKSNPDTMHTKPNSDAINTKSSSDPINVKSNTDASQAKSNSDPIHSKSNSDPINSNSNPDPINTNSGSTDSWDINNLLNYMTDNPGLCLAIGLGLSICVIGCVFYFYNQKNPIQPPCDTNKPVDESGTGVASNSAESQDCIPNIDSTLNTDLIVPTNLVDKPLPSLHFLNYINDYFFLYGSVLIVFSFLVVSYFIYIYKKERYQ